MLEILLRSTYQKKPPIDISVTEATVWNWEHGIEPELRHMPKIIDEFLGYVPFECSEDSIGKLGYFKLVRGCLTSV